MSYDAEADLQHKCILPPEEDIVVGYIDSGFFVNLRRSFRRFLTVNENSKRTRNYLRSTAAIRQEKARHLQHHYYMIHPFSECRAKWEMFMAFVFFCLLLIIPISNAMATNVLAWYIRIPKFILDLLCCTDIGITFMSGYYETYTKKIVLSQGRVAKRYLRGYFIIDFLSSIPIDLTVAAFNIHLGVYWWLIKILTDLKLLRITTFVKYLDRLRDRRGYRIYRFKGIKLVLIFIIAILWATSNVYLFNKANQVSGEELPIHQELLLSCFKALYNFLLIGYDVHQSESLLQQFFAILLLFIGVMLRCYIYAETLQVISKNLSSSNKYQLMLHQLNEYIRYKQLPDNMRKRIFMYFEFRFEKNYYKEGDILYTLSDNLRQDIILHTCQSLVESVEFFHNLPPALLRRIVKYMKSEIYLTNDVIVRAGFAGDTMYFIYSGTIAVYTSSGKEICHLADGGHFGEIALLMDSDQRVASVAAVECCELFTLNRKDFRRAISPYPDLGDRMRKLAQARLRKTLRVMDSELDSD